MAVFRLLDKRAGFGYFHWDKGGGAGMKKSILLLLGILIAFPSLKTIAAEGGHFEFNVHYSLWSINLVRPVIEDLVGDLLEDNLRDKFLEEIRRDYPSAREPPTASRSNSTPAAAITVSKRGGFPEVPTGRSAWGWRWRKPR